MPRHIAQEVLWRVGVGELVAVEWEAVGSVVESAHGDDGVEQFWAAEEEVGCVECSEATACDEEGLAFPSTAAGQEFVGYVVEPALVLFDAPAVVAAFV